MKITRSSANPPAAPPAGRPVRPAVRRRRRDLLLGGAGLLLAAALAAGFVARLGGGSAGPPPADDPFPLTPISASPFLNTGPDATYVGSESCRSCHDDRHETFRHTGMGRSMAAVDLSREPPDGAFDHPPSKRRYEVVRRDGQLWHRELLLADGAKDVLLSEFPVKYVVGSGRHSLTYVVEADGFLVESPVTWYTSRKAWGMSPGYDEPGQPGFGRAVGDGCLNCHAGRTEVLDRSLHRMTVVEAAIGCERCHGPGSLHVRKHAPDTPRPAGRGRSFDETIVNPARLSRDLAEAVCQQCHLRSAATIVARGRGTGDFRPGLPLQDFRADYAVEVPGAPMTVVGHVEQMHLSKCYQASDTLTCLTCHDPHGEPEPADRLEHYRAACQKCHQPAHCTVTAERRAKESPANDCVHCHMPTSPTEIPHLAFTHHRIGVHDRRPAATPGQTAVAQLRPFLDLSRLAEIDRRRSLGLGYLEAANREKDPGRSGWFREESFGLLSGVRRAGLREPAIEVALARLAFETGRGEVIGHVESALADPGLAGQDRCTALFLKADSLAERGRHAEAAAALRELTGLRRHPVDWLLLADCERALGRESAAEDALQTAVRIDPRLWKVHQSLADRYRQRGDAARAEWHQNRAVR